MSEEANPLIRVPVGQHVADVEVGAQVRVADLVDEQRAAVRALWTAR